jgi:hypothetical protein
VAPDPLSRLQVSRIDTLLEFRVVEIDLDAERPEALHALQLPELEVLDVASQIAKALKVFDVSPVLQGFAGLAVDDGNLAGLGHALGRPLDDGLVNTLLDNLISDVIRAVDVESLFVETKSDRERRIVRRRV